MSESRPTIPAKWYILNAKPHGGYDDVFPLNCFNGRFVLDLFETGLMSARNNLARVHRARADLAQTLRRTNELLEETQVLMKEAGLAGRTPRSGLIYLNSRLRFPSKDVA